MYHVSENVGNKMATGGDGTDLLLDLLDERLPVLRHLLRCFEQTADLLEEAEIPKGLHGALALAGRPAGHADHAACEGAVQISAVGSDIGRRWRSEGLDRGSERVQGQKDGPRR